eukprot:COSAG01_NODE_5160_length_4444_cov_3.051784_4_plen_115_part_00
MLPELGNWIGVHAEPPARPFLSSIFLDKNRRDIGKSHSIWTDSKMETAGSLVDPEVAVGDGRAEGGLVATAILDTHVAVFSGDVATCGALAIGLVEPVRVDSLKQCDAYGCGGR